jgi:tRNA 5-methylaminomethyl-2-thiouridine biosynthesis bifunctional protein
LEQDLDWTAAGPRSRRYDDIYYSPQDGLAESRLVFLEGCGLPQAWAGRAGFSVAELGFGTGLNIAALIDLWRSARPEAGRLSIFSVEQHPLTRAEAERALEPWRADLGEAVDVLLAAWPKVRAGLQRLDLPGFHATLDLWIGEVGEGLSRWSGPADAWFLDGFAPSRNPEMWRDEVLAAVGRLSAPGARLATFTVAGQVRRALAANGFEVAKRAGHGAKRERLEAWRPAGEGPRPRPKRVIVVGAGIGGAALARALTSLGVPCTIVEAVSPGAGASGNPAALVTPRLDAGFGPAAELHAQAFARATALYRAEASDALIGSGALQLGPTERDAARFARIAAWPGFAQGALRLLDEEAASFQLDETAAPGRATLEIADALVIEPAPLLETWLAGAERVAGAATRLERTATGWACLDAAGERLAEGDEICVTLGADTVTLLPTLPLRPVRGQVEWTTAPVFSGVAAAWGAYAIPVRDDGVLYGASHRRGDIGRDLRGAEAVASLEALAVGRPGLAARVSALPSQARLSRAATRAATADHLPLAGRTLEGAYVLAGLGGRGFTLAPLLAEHIAAELTGLPSPLPVDLAQRLRPERFGENPDPR